MDNERLVRCEESTKQAHKRIDALEHKQDTTDNKVENIYELTISVKEIATEMKHIREEQVNMNERLKIIEEKPSKNWDKIMNLVITRYSNSYIGVFFRKIRIVKKKEGGKYGFKYYNYFSNYSSNYDIWCYK